MINANLTLDDMRRLIASLADEPTPRSVRLAVQTFEALDAHLAAGGTPPEAWREGPDAPAEDDIPTATTVHHDPFAVRVGEDGVFIIRHINEMGTEQMILSGDNAALLARIIGTVRR